jgi:hypothetical protein
MFVENAGIQLQTFYLFAAFHSLHKIGCELSHRDLDHARGQTDVGVKDLLVEL